MRPGLTGNANTAVGNESLFTLTTGYSNSAFGHMALRQNTTGFNNTAIGKESMYNNGNGTWNTAVGYQSLRSATSPGYNTALGGQALYSIATGSGNTAVGHTALYSANFAASNNTALGYRAGAGIESGWGNVMIGYDVQPTSSGANHELNIGNWIYGRDGNIGIGTNNPLFRFEIDSGVADTSGMRFTRLNSNSPLTSNGIVSIGVNGSGEVVAVSPISNIAVYL